MPSNANSVNIEKRDRPYHHGDLRAALVAAALERIKHSAAEAVSLREVARQVGVSATAVYRHFPDKEALLQALCEAGDAILEAGQREAMAAAGGGQAGFDATGLAYVRFALAHPFLFRLMMKEGRRSTEGAGDGGAFGALQAHVAALLPTDASADQQRLRAIQAWSLVHGVAMLVLDGRLPADEALIAQVISRDRGGD